MNTKALVAGAVAILVAASGVPWLLGIRRVDPGVEPLVVTDTFPHETLEAVLQRFVSDDGRVDYTGLAADSTELRRYVATLGVVGPRTRPELFPTEAHAWHINAYNAVTLLGIVDSWPNAGVHDIHGPVNPKDGFGFFYGLRFLLDGGWTNTYDLENTAMRPRFDARLHAAINCASASCPRLSREAYVADELERQLDDAAAKTVRLSSIFQWFAGDFEARAKGLGVPGGVLGFIERYAEPTVASEVKAARDAGWPIEYVAYDWSLNGT